MKVKLKKALKHGQGILSERGEIVDLPEEQAKDYIARNLAVLPGAELDEQTPAAPAAPPADDGDAETEPLLDKDGEPLPPWTMKLTPIAYVNRFDSDAPNTELANQYIKAGHGDYKATLE